VEEFGTGSRPRASKRFRSRCSSSSGRLTRGAWQFEPAGFLARFRTESEGRRTAARSYLFSFDPRWLLPESPDHNVSRANTCRVVRVCLLPIREQITMPVSFRSDLPVHLSSTPLSGP
jgi:hypothetical protein